METSTAPNGCYNSDKSKGSIPLTIKFQQNSALQRCKVREVIETLIRETSVLQDTQFQVKEGVDWPRLQRFKEAATFTGHVHPTSQRSGKNVTRIRAHVVSDQILFPLQGTNCSEP